MILLIAPRTDLEYADEEVKKVVNFLHPRILLGTVTLSQVMDELQQYPAEIIWFVTHSDEEGILLSDGMLTASMLTQILGNSPPRLVFLNTCNSLPVAMEIHDALGCMVIGTIRNNPDREAFVTGSALARSIHQGLDLADAYNASRPKTNRTYVLLNASIQLNGEREIDDTNQLVLMVIKRQEELERKFKVQLEEYNAQVRRGRKLGPRQAIAWILGYGVFIISSFFVPHRLVDTFQLTPQGSLMVMVLMQILGAIFVMWGIGFTLLKDEGKNGEGRK